MEVSTMIGAEIFSPAGEKLGYVKSVYLSKDRKRITCLLCVDEGESGEDDEFVMPFRAVLSVKDVVIARDMRIAQTVGAPAPVGISAYSDTGEALGTLCEILVGDGGPVYIVTKNGVRTSYPGGTVIIGEALMISAEEQKKSARPRARRGGAKKEKTAAAPAKAKTAEAAEAPATPETAEAPDDSLEAAEAFEAAEAQQGDEFAAMLNAPAPMGLDRLNLLGRQVKIAVHDREGNVIAQSGDRITPEILSLARKNNLLLRLTVNTLTNLLQ